MSCKTCKSTRIATVGAKCSDLCDVSLGDADKDGYVPSDMGIGGGDNIEFKWCLNCGQIQGKFPLPTTILEGSDDPDEEDWERDERREQLAEKARYKADDANEKPIPRGFVKR